MSKITLSHIQTMKQTAEKITVLTAYDASFAQLLSDEGVDVLLVGDSLGTVVSGHTSTVPVTLNDVVYHTRCVARANIRSLIIADLPYMSYINVQKALDSATQLMQAGAEMVKLEGGFWLVDTIKELTQKGVPVCAHLGLTPQSVHLLGGYKVQGRHEDDAARILQDAKNLEQAGARMLVLECIPHTLAARVSQALTIPVIGIGAGVDCDGQVLVVYDMLGLTPGKPLKFVRNFMADQNNGIQGAVKNYVQQVKNKQFPTLEHSFS